MLEWVNVATESFVCAVGRALPGDTKQAAVLYGSPAGRPTYMSYAYCVGGPTTGYPGAERLIQDVRGSFVRIRAPLGELERNALRDGRARSHLARRLRFCATARHYMKPVLPAV
jgi:hypothetical protein